MVRLSRAVFVVLLVAGCAPRTPTQVLVVFDADDAVAARGARLRIDVYNQELQRLAWDINLVEGTVGATSFPVTVPLVPRGDDASRTFEIVGEVIDADGLVIARQRAISGYVEHQLREIVLRFEADCADVLCGFRTTCVAASCEDACVDPARRGEPARFHECEQRFDGGTPLDAGPPPDAAPPDAGPPDPTGCDDVHATSLFCDGFEEDFAARWGRDARQNGAIARVNDPVFRGTASLEARSTDLMAHDYVATDALDGLTGEFWVRFYLYVPAGQEIVQTDLLYLGESAAPHGGLDYGLGADGRIYATPQPEEVPVVTADPVLPFERWVCLEAHIVLNEPTDGMVEHFMDGTLLGSATGVDTTMAAGIQTLNVGLEDTYDTQPPLSVYIDEVVVDRTRIGCD